MGVFGFQVLSLPGLVALEPVAKIEGVLAPEVADVELPKILPAGVGEPKMLVDKGLGVEPSSGFLSWDCADAANGFGVDAEELLKGDAN